MQMTSEKNPRDAWAERWQAKRTGWDQGQAHPHLQHLMAMAREQGQLPDDARIFEPGCGRAHNAMQLVRVGYAVKAIDFVPEAIDEARKLYSDAKLELVVEDVMKVPATDKAAFNAVFDRAMLCALPAESRPAYLKACAERLKSGGLFMGIIFGELDADFAGGPPFAISIGELFDLLKEDFTICDAVTVPAVPNPPVVREEILIIARRR